MTTRRRLLAYSGGATLALYGYDRFGTKQAYAQIPGGMSGRDTRPTFESPGDEFTSARGLLFTGKSHGRQHLSNEEFEKFKVWVCQGAKNN